MKEQPSSQQGYVSSSYDVQPGFALSKPAVNLWIGLTTALEFFTTAFVVKACPFRKPACCNNWFVYVCGICPFQKIIELSINRIIIHAQAMYQTAAYSKLHLSWVDAPNMKIELFSRIHH